MKTPYLVVIATAACTTGTVHQATLAPAAQARAEGGRPPYTAADVRFMAGMIGHHAQAVLMGGWAPSHGASIFTRSGNTMTFQSYYKLPAPQTAHENCVAHNGTLIPMDSTKLVGAGSWSAYWYNGYIVSSEISRGLDIFALQPSAFISQNELDAAKLIHLDYLNAQDQQQLVWPAGFVVARAYVDQLARDNGLSRERCGAITAMLRRAEQLKGDAQRGVLQQLATDLQRDAQAAADQAKVRTLAATVTDLAGAAR